MTLFIETGEFSRDEYVNKDVHNEVLKAKLYIFILSNR